MKQVALEFCWLTRNLKNREKISNQRQWGWMLAFFLIWAPMVVAQEYTAKVGDTLTVAVSERGELSGTRVVDVNGQITLPSPIGTMEVLGLNAEQIRALLVERLKASIKSPTIIVAISPATDFTLHVTGEVESPTTFKTPEGTSLQEAIARAGGFTPLADKRNIKILRRDTTRRDITTEQVVDLTRFLEEADLASNPALRMNDIVVVPRLSQMERINTVLVIGAVGSPGAITVDTPLRLVDLLARAGGPAGNADLKHVSILSRQNDGQYVSGQYSFDRFLVAGDPSANPMLAAGDVAFLPVLPPEDQHRVTVMGLVSKPGTYPVEKDMRVLGAIYAAGGFAEGSAMDEVVVIRPSSNPEPERVTVNLKEFIATGDTTHNPALALGDIVYVPAKQGMPQVGSGAQSVFLETIGVTAIGEVQKSGSYQLAPNTTILELLKVSGGPTRDANLKKAQLIRENDQSILIDLETAMQSGGFTSLPLLQANDTLFIPRIEEKPSAWKSFVRTALDVATIVTTFLLIERRVND